MSRFIAYPTYYQQVKQQVDANNQQVQTIQKNIADNERNQATERDQILQFSRILEENGDNKIYRSKNNSGFRYQDNTAVRKLQAHRKNLNKLVIDNRNLKKQLTNLLLVQKKLNALFQKIAKNPDGSDGNLKSATMAH